MREFESEKLHAMKNEPNTVVPASRQVIERKVLAVLDDENKVAIIASKQDLEDLIAALSGYEIGVTNGNIVSWEAYGKRRVELRDGMKQLLKEAFV